MQGKTIKQIADELGVDKQKVYRYIKKNHINDAHHDAGVMYFDEAVESSVKSHFFDKTTSSDAHHDVHQTTSNDAVIDVLLKQSEMLQKELEMKNKQIDDLNKRLADSQKLLDQQQQLHALTEKKLLQLETQLEEEMAITEDDEKKPWWKFW